MYTLVAGVAVKILLNYVLVGIPSVNIHGGPLASIACYSISMIPNLYFVLKYARMRFNWQGWLLRPAAATAAMGIVVFAMRRLLPVSRLMTLVEIALGVAVYVAAALLFKAVTPSDFQSLRRRKKA